MRPLLKIFADPAALAQALAHEFIVVTREILQKQQRATIVLSGGSTPTLFFIELVKISAQFSHWDRVFFFWGDERCVPPDHPESNYGTAQKFLLEHIPVPDHHIFRIYGENDPAKEVIRYAAKINEVLKLHDRKFPIFDWIFLGLGDDGHTASLFPDSDTLRVSDKICAVAQHPLTGQFRITLTLPVINRARRVTFLVSGQSKSKILSEIIGGVKGKEKYPASLVYPKDGKVIWMLDEEASHLL